MTATVLYFFMAIFFYGLAFMKSRDAFHPIGVGSLIWFLAASLSSYTPLYDPALQIALSEKTHTVITLSGMMFFLPVLFSKKINKKHLITSKIYFTDTYKIIFNSILIVVSIAFLLRFGKNIFSPVILGSSVNDLKENVPAAIPFINYADIFTPFAAIICYSEIRYSITLTQPRKFFLIGFILFSIVVSICYKVSRGDFFVFALGVIYLYITTHKTNFSIKRIALIGSFFLISMCMALYRIPEDSRASTQFGNSFYDIIFSHIYTYIAMNFQNLNMLVNFHFEPTLFLGTMKFFLKYFFVKNHEIKNLGIIDFSTSFFNAKTYLYYFYHDLNFFGILIYPLIISFILLLFYNFSMTQAKYIIFISFFMKAVFFMFFGNYFFGELVIIFPYMVLFVIILTLKSVSDEMYVDNKQVTIIKMIDS